jgi:hypothetical protein
MTPSISRQFLCFRLVSMTPVRVPQTRASMRVFEEALR